MYVDSFVPGGRDEDIRSRQTKCRDITPVFQERIMLDHLAHLTAGFHNLPSLQPVNVRHILTLTSTDFVRFLFSQSECGQLLPDVHHVPDHDEAPVVAADQPAGVEVETADRVGVTSQYTELLPRPDPAPQDDLAVEAGRPDAEG